MAKRLLALVLSVLMLVQSLPVSALAKTIYSNVLKGEEYYTVVFTVEEGAEKAASTITQYLAEDGTLVLPEAPAKAGYQFIGWYVGETKLAEGQTVSSDLTAEARFAPITAYTVTVQYLTEENGAYKEALDSVVRTYATTETEIDTIESPASIDVGTGGVVKLRYPDQSKIEINPAELTGDVTYTVYYNNANTKYTVRYLTDALDETAADVVEIGGEKYDLLETEELDGVVGTFITPTTKAFEGMQFVGTEGMMLKETNDTPIDMIYERNRYVLSYDSNGGSSREPVMARYGETVLVYSGTEVAGTTELTCGKEEHTHVAATGTASKNNVNRTSGCYKCVATTTTTGSGRNKKTTTTYSWQLNCTKEEHTHSASCYTTTPGEIVDNDPPTRDGYTFGGWYTDKACTQKADSSIVMTKNVVVYAKWIAATVSYSIVYMKENNDGGYDYLSTATKSATVGTTVTASGSASFSDSAYYHWAGEDSATDSMPYSAVAAADGSTVVYGLYDFNTYYLKFDFNGKGSAMKLEMDGVQYGDNQYIITCHYGQVIQAIWPSSDNIVWTGTNSYKFGGWNVGSTAGTCYNSKRFNVTAEMLSSTTNGSTTTYYANWPSSVREVKLHYMRALVDNPSTTINASQGKK